jgi:ethanolamine utilization cobalamin adenosyltransferase
MPDFSDSSAVLALNRVRCAVRNAELKAVAALTDREDLLRALNRLSSAVYILMIREK